MLCWDGGGTAGRSPESRPLLDDRVAAVMEETAKVRRRTLGLLLVLAVVALWVGSSAAIQYIFNAVPRPRSACT